MMRSYFVQFTYVDDVLARRQPYRTAHLERLRLPPDAVELLLAGAYADPVDGAVLALRAESAGDVEAWVRADPYYEAGLIVDFTVREVTLVVPEAPAAVP